MIKKLANIFEYFKGILATNVLICVLPFLFGSLDFFVVMFLVFGFASALLIHELSAKKTDIFYFNNGVSQWQLWLGAFTMNAVVLIFILLATALIRIYVG